MTMFTRSALARGLTIVSIAIISIAIGTPLPAVAQSPMLALPDVSQAARVTQRIGLTDMTVAYHRPLVAGRTIFGGVQPYGQVWRAGANANTTFEVTDPVIIEGKPLGRGIYGVHMIPGERSWVVIFSRNATSWGSFSYDSTEDALRVSVVPVAIAPQEVLTYAFDAPAPTSTVLTMRWDRVAVPIRIDVDVPHLVAQSLREQLRGRIGAEWQPWEEAANFLLQNSLGADEALRDVEQSIAIEDRFENEITKARALTALGRTADANAAQTRALALGTQRQVYEFGRSLQRLSQQETALRIYQDDAVKHPGTWISHEEVARAAVGHGDYASALREMRLARAAAPPSAQSSIQDLEHELEQHVDINR